MKKKSWSECSILVQIEILLFFAIFWCMDLWNGNVWSKDTNDGRITLEIGFSCCMQLPLHKMKKKSLSECSILVRTEISLCFAILSYMNLWNGKLGSKVTNNGRIASQIDFNCLYADPIAQNEEKVLVRMLNWVQIEMLLFFAIFWCMDLWNGNLWSKETNNGRITLQTGLSCLYAAPIAQNEEKVLVRMPYFSLGRDFIGFCYISMYGLMKQTFRVKSDK